MLERLRRSRKRSKTQAERIAPDGWSAVATAPNEMMAGMMEGALESEGVPYMDKKLGLDFPTSPTNMHAIIVPSQFEEKARSILEGICDLDDEG